MDNKKIDLINSSYSQLRISGITVQATPEDNVLALRRLEGMASEFFARNICTGYNFEETPDLNSTCGLEQAFWYPYECMLALRLMADFGKGKEPDPLLVVQAQLGMSFLYARAAKEMSTPYPSRQPIGSGNSLKYGRFRKFYQTAAAAPDTCETIRMFVGDVDDFVAHFDSYLVDAETISAYTINADTGLTVTSSSLTSPDVAYRITAVGSSSNALLRVKIIATTSTGRIVTKIINFELTKQIEIS